MKYLNSNEVVYATSLAKAPWLSLKEDTNFQGFLFAAGSEYKAFETPNAGWVCFHPSTKTPSGDVAHRRLFKI